MSDSKNNINDIDYLEDLEKDQEYIAYRDQKCFTVWVTKPKKGGYCYGGCIGRIRFVFDQNDRTKNPLAVAWPMRGLDNDFELISREMLKKYNDIVNSYDMSDVFIGE